MFAKTIIDSDAFIDMPASSRLLYYDLSMRADDDGFVNSPKKIARMTGASDDDIKMLILKNFIIPFESGVVVIKHWKIHNYIQSDRYKATIHQEEKGCLELTKTRVYELKDASPDAVVSEMYPECIQNVSTLDTQDRLGKDRLGKDRLDKDRLYNGDADGDKPPRTTFKPPSVEEVEAYCLEKGYSVDAERFVNYYESIGWMVGKNKMKKWKSAVATWAAKDNKKKVDETETERRIKIKSWEELTEDDF